MLVSEGLRKYSQKLFPDQEIDEESIEEAWNKLFPQFHRSRHAFQIEGKVESMLEKLMSDAPDKILKMKNGYEEIPGDLEEAINIMAGAIATARILEKINETTTALIDEIFTPAILQQLLKSAELS